jgi:hypothetical protein
MPSLKSGHGQIMSEFTLLYHARPISVCEVASYPLPLETLGIPAVLKTSWEGGEYGISIE